MIAFKDLKVGVLLFEFGQHLAYAAAEKASFSGVLFQIPRRLSSPSDDGLIVQWLAGEILWIRVSLLLSKLNHSAMEQLRATKWLWSELVTAKVTE